MTETITLGGREFRLQPLTLGQLRPLLDALGSAAGAATGASGMSGNMIDAAARILLAGLAGAHPELTLDDVLALEATVTEINAAVAAVLRVAGLVPQADARSGEAGPVATISEPGSAPSMAPSPPAAATPIA